MRLNKVLLEELTASDQSSCSNDDDYPCTFAWCDDS